MAQYTVNPDTGQLDIVGTGGGGGGSGTTDFVTNSGTAVESGGQINVLGTAAQGVTTSATGLTVTITNANASTSQKGVLETATDAEAVAASSTTAAMTPSNMVASYASPQPIGSTAPSSGAFTTFELTADQVQVSEGGTGTNTLLDGGILIGNGTGAIQSIGPMTDGTVLIGRTGLDPSVALLTAGSGITITPASGSITIAQGVTVPTTFNADSGSAQAAVNVLDVVGGSGVNTSASGSEIVINIDSPVTVATGGTGSTSFTAGSVIFSDGSILTEDNANLFFDNTNNRLGIGIATPLDTLHVSGAMELDHTAIENDDHAFEIVCDAAGFSDVKALDIDYITGAVAAGKSEEAILINIDESLATGGQIVGMQVLSTNEGSDEVIAMKCGPGIDAIRQGVGTFVNMDSALNKAVDVLAALSSGGAGNITMFVADNDTITIGDAATFGAMEIIIDTPASGSGIAPTFEYSTGVGTWGSFGPADGTNGFRNTGVIEWDVADLAGFAVGTGSEYLIRITRTRNTLATSPIVDKIQISALTEYVWDKDGVLGVKELTLVTPLALAYIDDAVAASVGSDSGTATPTSHSFSIVGTGGVTTSATGTTVTVDGSGVVASSSLTQLALFDDFLHYDYLTTTTTGYFNWRYVTAGTAEQASTAGHPGIVAVDDEFYSAAFILIGSGEITLETWIRVYEGSEIDSLWGLSSSTDLYGATNAIFFSAKSANSTYWQTKTVKAGATTTTTTSSLIGNGSWVHLKMVIASGGGSVEFFIDDVSVGTHSTNIPLTTTALRIMWDHGGNGSPAIDVDAVNLIWTLTGDRA